MMKSAPAVCIASACLLLAAAGCRQGVKEGTVQQPAETKYAEHPGQITTYYAWNKTSKTEAASGFPDALKWKYYAADGSETSDARSAKYRVPVVEVRIVSVDGTGAPVDPQHALRLSIDSYGPNHKFLSHTDASARP